MADNIFSDYLPNDSVLIGEEPGESKHKTELFTDDQLLSRDKSESTEDVSSNPDEKNKPPPVDIEFEKLKKRSSNSVLIKHLQVEELNQLKIENEKITFLKKAGTVAEFKFMEFLYFGYMEKANLDLIKMVKKIKMSYESLVPKENLGEVIEILNNEISYVLTSIKKKQAEDVKDWKDGQ